MNKFVCRAQSKTRRIFTRFCIALTFGPPASAGNSEQQLQDLYLNDNNLEGGIPERMVVNCECLQRLYLGGNRLTGTVSRQLRHLRELRELNIERNNLHGEVCGEV